MTLPSDTTLALISWLASRNTEQLQSLIRRRGIPHSACTSYRSLAQALQGAENIRASVQHLPRAELLALNDPDSATAESRNALEERGLISLTSEGTSLLIPSSSLDPLGKLDSASKEPSLPAAPSLAESDISAAASHALTLVVTVSDLLDAIADARFPLNQDGELTATSLKNLQSELGIGYDIPLLWRCATQAGLLGPHNSAAALTQSAVDWRDLPDEERLALLAKSWWSTVPAWLSQTISGHPTMTWDSTLLSHLSYHYPLVDAEPVLTEVLSDAQMVGVLHGSLPTPWGLALWSSGDVATAFRSSIPPYAPGVFAHDDYTLLASGPLQPHHRRVLASITARELGGLVPRYRMTAASVLNALQDGVRPESIPTVLAEVCVNEVPASMIALAEDVTRRALDLEVHPQGDSTTLTTRRDALSDELLSDPGLIVLGLKRSGDRELRCSWPAERVHSTLLAASYPSLLVDSSGAPLASNPPLVESRDMESEERHHTALAELVASAHESAAKGVPAGFTSIIEVATETKTPLEIVVTMPDGSSVTVVMEPRALSAGRLRGVELKHAVEKTFPVSHITSVRAWSQDDEED